MTRKPNKARFHALDTGTQGCNPLSSELWEVHAGGVLTHSQGRGCDHSLAVSLIQEAVITVTGG